MFHRDTWNLIACALGMRWNHTPEGGKPSVKQWYFIWIWGLGVIWQPIVSSLLMAIKKQQITNSGLFQPHSRSWLRAGNWLNQSAIVCSHSSWAVSRVGTIYEVTKVKVVVMSQTPGDNHPNQGTIWFEESAEQSSSRKWQMLAILCDWHKEA